MKALVIDTETTGLDITIHEIIDIAFIEATLNLVGEYKIVDQYSVKIKPMNLHSADKYALKINGYNDYDWKNSRPITEILDMLKAKIESVEVLVGQNLIFDMRFIKQSFINHGKIPPIFPKYIDTKRMAMPLVKSGVLKASNMDVLCEHYKISYSGKAHTALADCERTLKAWKCLLNDSVEMPFYTYEKNYDPYKA